MDCVCAGCAGVRMILCGNPRAQYLSYKSEIDAAISRVLYKLDGTLEMDETSPAILG